MFASFHRNNYGGLIRPADVVLWLVALAVLFGLAATFWGASTSAQQLRVILNDEVVEERVLTQNQRFLVNGALGDSEIEVRDGKVRFVSSPCRNQVCVHQGWASHSGELLACLPNRIAVVLEGVASPAGPDVDAVNF